MGSYHTITPEARRNALISLENHPGWALYCERVANIVKNELDAKIFNPKTSDEERRTLVAARPLLVDSNAPDQLRRGMITACETQMKNEERTARANATATG